MLIAPLSESQKVKDVVAALKAEGAFQAEEFPFSYRPWGYYQSLIVGEHFQVKEIVVKPGAQLSLQSHKFRSEHWVVVQGQADVVVGKDLEHLETKNLKTNESVYISVGEINRRVNPGSEELHLIEVQTGS